MNQSARDDFDKLDVKKNLGLDFYQFESHVRDFVLELVEPTIVKTNEDHSLVLNLQNSYEGLKQKLETLTFETNKLAKKIVSQNEFHLRCAEIERSIIKSGETLNTDMKKVQSNFEVVKDKVGIVQLDLLQFNKVNANFQNEFDKVHIIFDTLKEDMMEHVVKLTEQLHDHQLDFKKRIQKVEEEIRAARHVTDTHTQFIREYEIRQSIFQNSQVDIIQDEFAKVSDGIQEKLTAFDKKLMSQRIDFSDEIQNTLKNSREELLRAFRQEYMAKRISKGTQASHLDIKPRQQNNVGALEILPPIILENLEYNLAERCPSAYPPRRSALPPPNTPPKKRKRTNYHLLPLRICLSTSDHSYISDTLLREKEEDHLARQRTEQKKLELQRKLYEEEQERIRIEIEKNKTIEEMVPDSVKMSNKELIKVEEMAQAAIIMTQNDEQKFQEEEVVEEDQEMRFLKQEEQQIQEFYQMMFPPEVLKQGMPDFPRFLKLLEDNKFKISMKQPKGEGELVQMVSFSRPSSNIQTQKEDIQINQDVSISDFKPHPPGQNLQVPHPPIFHRDANQDHHLYEYIQDCLLQLRDELTVRLNDSLIELEMKHNAQLELINQKLAHPPEAPKNQNSIVRSSRDSKLIHQDSKLNQSFNKIESKAINGDNNQTHIVDIEQLTQQTLDKCKQDFNDNISYNLRRAQARVVAHMRMETRSLLKLWSLRIKKDISAWMAKTEDERDASNQYVKQMDERGRTCEQQQFEIIQILQKQMKSLEDKFSDLKEQQQKILFGSNDNETEKSDNEEDKKSVNQGTINSPIDSQQSKLQIQTAFSRQQSNMTSNGAQNKQPPFSKPGSNLQTPKQMSVVGSNQQLQIQPLQPSVHSNSRDIQQLNQLSQSPPQQVQLDQTFNRLPTNVQSQGGRSFIAAPLQSAHSMAPQVPNLPTSPIVATSPISSFKPQPQVEPIQIQQLDASPKQVDPIPSPQVNLVPQISPTPSIKELPPNSPPPQIMPVQPSPVQSQQPSPRQILPSQASQTQLQPIPEIPVPITTVEPQPVQQESSPRMNVRAPVATSPFRRPTFKPMPSQDSVTIIPRGNNRGSNLVKNIIAEVQQAEATVVKQIVDTKTQEAVKKQKKKLAILDMQIMALVTQQKGLEKEQKEILDHKVKDIVVEYFKKQMDELDIYKLKSDFELFTSKMEILEDRLTQKMRDVEIMYNEVDGGFKMNARDRSDYLIHYERINSTAEAAITNFKDQLSELQIKYEKLSTCVLSIVNEEEAQQIKHIPNYDEIYQWQMRHQQQQQESTNTMEQLQQQMQKQQQQEMIQLRNGEATTRFKNISDLANEINYQNYKNQAGLASYFDGTKQPIPQKTATLLPQVTQANKTQTISKGSIEDPKKKFSYTDFVDQALVSSIHNVPLDVKNHHHYVSNQSNPTLRTSVNGLISHRIKNLLGAGNGASIYNNYSQQVFDPMQKQGDYQGMGKDESKYGSSAKKISGMKRDLFLANNTNSVRSSLGQLNKNDFNFESTKQISGQKRAGSQIDNYSLKLNKHMINQQFGLPSPGFRNIEEGTPLMLQALIGTHSISSKDNFHPKRKQKHSIQLDQPPQVKGALEVSSTAKNSPRQISTTPLAEQEQQSLQL